MADDTERPSLSCEKLRAELNRNMLEVAQEENVKLKCEKLEGVVLGTFGGLIDVVVRMARRIPRRPWIVNVVGGVSLMAVVGLAWAAGERLAKMEARDDAICVQAASACEKADKATAQVGRVERRMARIDGNLDALMRSRGLRPLPPVPDSLDSLP
jgi:hypothetical protein